MTSLPLGGIKPLPREHPPGQVEGVTPLLAVASLLSPLTQSILFSRDQAVSESGERRPGVCPVTAVFLVCLLAGCLHCHALWGESPPVPGPQFPWEALHSTLWT